MAAQLPFEAQQPAERTAARDERRRMVESWVTGEATSRFFKYSGQSWEALKLVIEDTILDVAAINPANAGETELAKTRMLNRLRESHGTVSEAFKRSRIGVVLVRIQWSSCSTPPERTRILRRRRRKY